MRPLKQRLFHNTTTSPVLSLDAFAFRYIQTGSLWPGTSVSRVARRDPSSADGGAQNARDDAAFDGNKVAQALAVAQRAEQQAQEVARKVSQAQAKNIDRFDGIDAALGVLKSDVNSRISAITRGAQAVTEATQGQLSKFRADIGIINEKVASVAPLSDAVQAQVQQHTFFSSLPRVACSDAPCRARS